MSRRSAPRRRDRIGLAARRVETLLHLPCPAPAALPWDHINVRQGREYLEREYERSVEQTVGE